MFQLYPCLVYWNSGNTAQEVSQYGPQKTPYLDNNTFFKGHENGTMAWNGLQSENMWYFVQFGTICTI